VGDRELGDLVADGVIERVEADRHAAAHELATARLHLTSAASIAASDPIAAFAVGYEAMRKAIAAHMRCDGFRVKPGRGHHQRTGRYALAALDGQEVREHVHAFDELRLLRNQSQYEGLDLEPEDVTDLLRHARGLVDAIERDLVGLGPPPGPEGAPGP
jgi:hypothetical protein